MSIDNQGRAHAPEGIRTGGQYETERKGEPPAASLARIEDTPVVIPQDFDELYTAVTRADADDEMTYDTYDAALAAAEGNPERIWKVSQGELPAGTIIWKFNLDDDEQIVSAPSEEEAAEQAAELFKEQYNESDAEEGDEDYQDVDPDDLSPQGPYMTTDPDQDIFDEESWHHVTDTWASPLNPASNLHVNVDSYVVSTEPWKDLSEEYLWQ